MRSSQTICNAMFNGIISTKLRFFDTNPSGRILNRFSKDIGWVELTGLFLSWSSQHPTKCIDCSFHLQYSGRRIAEGDNGRHPKYLNVSWIHCDYNYGQRILSVTDSCDGRHFHVHSENLFENVEEYQTNRRNW